jgi:hypothetical protein
VGNKGQTVFAKSETFVICPDKVYEIEIRRGVAISCGFNSRKSKGHIKFAARDIVIEDIFIVGFQKYEEEFVEVEIVQRVGMLSKDESQEGGVCHSNK